MSKFDLALAVYVKYIIEIYIHFNVLFLFSILINPGMWGFSEKFFILSKY